MDLGLFVAPQQGASYDDQLRAARAAEAAGFSDFVRSDHYLGFGAAGAAEQQGYDRAMPRTQTMVQLTDSLVELLDREAARRGISRSALIRDLLEEALRDEREAELSRRIVEGYTRIPPGLPDEWGHPADEADAATGDLLLRLDGEERDAGLRRW